MSRDVLADAIASTAPEMARSVDADGAMCTAWIVIAEWTDSNGDYWMTRQQDETSPSWRVKGLLHDALYQQAGDDA